MPRLSASGLRLCCGRHHRQHRVAQPFVGVLLAVRRGFIGLAMVDYVTRAFCRLQNQPQKPAFHSVNRVAAHLSRGPPPSRYPSTSLDRLPRATPAPSALCPTSHQTKPAAVSFRASGRDVGPADRQAGGDVFPAIGHDSVLGVPLEHPQFRPLHLRIEPRTNYSSTEIADHHDVIAVAKIAGAAGVDLDHGGLPEDPDAGPGLLDQAAQRIAADLADDVVDADQRLTVNDSRARRFSNSSSLLPAPSTGIGCPVAIRLTVESK